MKTMTFGVILVLGAWGAWAGTSTSDFTDGTLGDITSLQEAPPEFTVVNGELVFTSAAEASDPVLPWYPTRWAVFAQSNLIGTNDFHVEYTLDFADIYNDPDAWNTDTTTSRLTVAMIFNRDRIAACMLSGGAC